jgi:hypothetical protein
MKKATSLKTDSEKDQDKEPIADIFLLSARLSQRKFGYSSMPIVYTADFFQDLRHCMNF